MCTRPCLSPSNQLILDQSTYLLIWLGILMNLNLYLNILYWRIYLHLYLHLCTWWISLLRWIRATDSSRWGFLTCTQVLCACGRSSGQQDLNSFFMPLLHSQVQCSGLGSYSECHKGFGDQTESLLVLVLGTSCWLTHTILTVVHGRFSNRTIGDGTAELHIWMLHDIRESCHAVPVQQPTWGNCVIPSTSLNPGSPAPSAVAASMGLPWFSLSRLAWLQILTMLCKKMCW